MLSMLIASSAASDVSDSRNTFRCLGMLDGILGYSGRANGSVIQYSVPRAETIIENGHQLLPAMGVATPINFQPSGAASASITGDFVLMAGEVEAVAGALRSNGIDVTAMHQHHLNEVPRLFYMHFWANGDPALAQGLRAGLDQTNGAAEIAPVVALGK